jgi:hypothetical protein
MTHASAQLPTNIALLRQCPQPPPQAYGFFPALGLNRAVTIGSRVCAHVFINDRVEEGPVTAHCCYCHDTLYQFYSIFAAIVHFLLLLTFLCYSFCYFDVHFCSFKLHNSSAKREQILLHFSCFELQKSKYLCNQVFTFNIVIRI